jgi:predicted TIM-barrel fold metal-dependent hydrolase
MDLALRTPEMTTPDVVNAILLECASLSGDANFGLRMVELADTEDLGIYGYLLMNAPTVGEAQQQQQAQQQATAAQQQRELFNKAFSACMQAKSYTVN